jgi:Fe-S cluster biogenesis protein NfuA
VYVVGNADGAAVRAAVSAASALFRSHGGRVQLAGLGPDGAVTVEFGGLCAGCPVKAGCLEHTVRPVVEAVPGVRSVAARGARVSDEAAARLRSFLPPAAGHGLRR